jgi:hypothetical protein
VEKNQTVSYCCFTKTKPKTFNPKNLFFVIFFVCVILSVLLFDKPPNLLRTKYCMNIMFSSPHSNHFESTLMFAPSRAGSFTSLLATPPRPSPSTPSRYVSSSPSTPISNTPGTPNTNSSGNVSNGFHTPTTPGTPLSSSGGSSLFDSPSSSHKRKRLQNTPNSGSSLFFHPNTSIEREDVSVIYSLFSTDRFIPCRARLQHEHANFLLNKESQKEETATNYSRELYKTSLSAVVFDESPSRILSFSPNKKESKARKQLLFPNVSPTDEDSTSRAISKTPEFVLEAPEMVDDYYLNLLDWGKSNSIAVALGKLCLFSLSKYFLHFIPFSQPNQYMCGAQLHKQLLAFSN